MSGAEIQFFHTFGGAKGGSDAFARADFRGYLLVMPLPQNNDHKALAPQGTDRMPHSPRNEYGGGSRDFSFLIPQQDFHGKVSHQAVKGAHFMLVGLHIGLEAG
jgi:hypothetical protein